MNLAGTEAREEFAAAWRYLSNPAFHDELIAANGNVRPQWHPLVDSLLEIGPEGLARRWQEGRRLVHENGITYNVYGDPQSTDRPWPLDPIPDRKSVV